MKKIKFKRVSIVKETRDFKVFNKYDWKSRNKERERILNELNYESIGFEKWNNTIDRKMAQYERTLKRDSTEVSKSIWKIIGSDGHMIGRFDSLEQAKRYCLKNDLDYGYF